MTTTPPPPREILGSIGSRIRVIFGEDGNSWLLLLNHDDGNRKWQDQYWSSIPDAVSKQLRNCINKGRFCHEVDYGRYYGWNGITNPWFIRGMKNHDGTGSHYWWGDVTDETDNDDIRKFTSDYGDSLQVSFGELDGCPSMCLLGNTDHQTVGYSYRNLDSDLERRIKRIYNRSKRVDFVRLFQNGNFFIRDSNGTEWKGISQYCSEELSKGGTVEDLAVAGDGSWLIIRPDSYEVSCNVDQDLTKELDRFYNDQRQRMIQRGQEIAGYHTAQREEAERLRREEEERLQRLERDAAERAEAERRRAEEEARREEAERLEREEEERRQRLEESRKAAHTEASKQLEAKLVEQLVEEKKNIGDLERQLDAMQSHLKTRKRSLQASLESLPPESRRRLESDDDDDENGRNARIASRQEENQCCVICHDAVAIKAAIPCGHLCLCEGCGSSLTMGPRQARLCPLCREPVASTIRIFGQPSS